MFLSFSEKFNPLGDTAAGQMFAFGLGVSGIILFSVVALSVSSINKSNTEDYTQQMTKWVESSVGVQVNRDIVEQLIEGRVVSLDNKNVILSLQKTKNNHVELMQTEIDLIK